MQHSHNGDLQQSHQHASSNNNLGAAAVPRLLPDLRLALASLYALPMPPQQQRKPLPSPQQTHDFLMHVQSRNVRRKIRSIQQQHRDQPRTDNSAASSTTETVVHMGSAWLACLALLCRLNHAHPNDHPNGANASQQQQQQQPLFDASSTERLFAAQTLLHRLRRVKIVEAVDIEIESWADTNDKAWLLQCYSDDNGEQQSTTTSTITDHLVANYQQWMIQCCNNHFCAQVLSSMDNNPSTSNGDEDRLKAELTVLTLATTAYLQAFDPTVSEHERMPLLMTTLSALATAVFRLRYDLQSSTSAGTNGNQPQQQQQPALLTVVHHAFQIVWKTACAQNHIACSTHINNYEAWAKALLLCVAILPDAIIGSPGGARGRLSVDPQSLRAASQDLRKVDTQLLVDILLQTQQHAGEHDNSNNTHLWILQACAKWATFLPLSLPLLQLTLPLVNQFLMQPSPPRQQSTALTFLIAVYESGSWTEIQILSSAMGLSDHQMVQQQTKKKQSTRSKKRQKERIENNRTETSIEEALAERHLRGEMACQTTVQCWTALHATFQVAVAQAALDAHYLVEGEGPIGCMAACASACLPHILRHPATSPHGRELFLNITQAFQQLCASPQKIIRALALEPLYTLHSVLIEVVQATGPLEKELEAIVVEHLFQCSMNIASACGYPLNYFDHLEAESDQDLEIERNDVRDLLRTVSGSGEGGSTVNPESTEVPFETTTRVLGKLVDACREAIASTHQRPDAFPESAVHALSSLAKPLNYLSKCYTRYGGSEDIRNILGSVLQALVEMNQILLAGFQQNLTLRQMLPMSRIVNIANASFAPFLCALASVEDEAIGSLLARMLDFAILGSILSLERLPELCAPSILEHSQYDIRGTMRGPGGEDHVAILTLMRFAFEDEALGRQMVQSSARYTSRFCELHQTLKQLEVERGRDVTHGRGVCPQSRRIYVGMLCHLEVRSQGQLGASEMLSGLFNAATAAVSRFQSKSEFNEEELYLMTESALDLASFSPTIVASLFQPCLRSESDSSGTGCLEVLTTACVYGYRRWSTTSEGNPTIAQWNRLRAALFLFLRKAATDGDIPERGAAMISDWVAAECEAIHHQCAAGPESRSSLFVEEILCPDSDGGIPAGLFVRCIAEVLLCAGKNSTDRHGPFLPNSMKALNTLKGPVLSVITLHCPDPREGAFVDPRPTVCEAWLQAMIELAELKLGDPLAEALLIETCTTMVSLLFMPTMGRSQSERLSDPCMTLDGPHSIALTTFLSVFFQLGPCALQTVGQRLLGTIPVDFSSIHSICPDPSFRGVSVVGAALFRACQGALPPWAVEAIPEVYSSLFEACGNDVEAFGLLMRLSMEVRLLSSHPGYGGVPSGQLLSGRCFESMSDLAKGMFITQTKELCAKGGMASWRRLKVLIKQACGGKKRDTEFNQKPAVTRWEFQRV